MSRPNLGGLIFHISQLSYPHNARTKLKLPRSQFVQPVQRRDLVRFRERRIIEYRVAKIFDRRSPSHSTACPM